MMRYLIRRWRAMSLVNRSSSSLAGRRPNSKRDAVSKKVDLALRSSIRIPRYSRTPRWPSTSLTADLAAGTPANPGMKSCGIFLPPASVRFYLGVSEIDAELDSPSIVASDSRSAAPLHIHPPIIQCSQADDRRRETGAAEFTVLHSTGSCTSC